MKKLLVIGLLFAGWSNAGFAYKGAEEARVTFGKEYVDYGKELSKSDKLVRAAVDEGLEQVRAAFPGYKLSDVEVDTSKVEITSEDNKRYYGYSAYVGLKVSKKWIKQEVGLVPVLFIRDDETKEGSVVCKPTFTGFRDSKFGVAFSVYKETDRFGDTSELPCKPLH